MSVVTGIVLCTSIAETPTNFSKIDAWLADHSCSSLHEVDEHCCNGKHPQMSIRGGGYNYFSNEEFLQFFKTLLWAYPENVVLVLQPEDGTTVVLRGRMS